jgi:hypothetical protein
MILKTKETKIGLVHCLRVERLVKKTDGRLKKEPFTFILTDYELRELQNSINDTIGIKDEHLLAVEIPKRERRKAINTVVEPEIERRNILGTALEIEV